MAIAGLPCARTLEGVELLAVDGLGHLPLEANAAHPLFQPVSRRHERGAMLVTNNRSVADAGGVFGDAVAAPGPMKAR